MKDDRGHVAEQCAGDSRASSSASRRPPRAQTVQTDPLQCWWRTSAGAVRVGEPFTVVLTCAVLETDDGDGGRRPVAARAVGRAVRAVRGARRLARRRPAHRPAPLLPVRVPAAADRREHVRQGRRAAGDEDQLPRPEQGRPEDVAAGPRSDLHAAGAVDARAVAGAGRRLRHPRHLGERDLRRHRSARVPRQPVHRDRQRAVRARRR